MLAARSSCETIRSLRRIHPPLLRAVLRRFPGFLRKHVLPLSGATAPNSLLCEVLQAAWVAGAMPQDLRDALFYATCLGDAAGWEHIQEEARSRDLPLDFAAKGLSHLDMALTAWLVSWPQDKALLGVSYARARIRERSSFLYFFPARDIRAAFAPPSPQGLAALGQELAPRAGGLPNASSFKVTCLDTGGEICFLLRRQLRRHASRHERLGSPRDMLWPEEYDVVAYNKARGHLRMTTSRVRDRLCYRIAFGRALFGTPDVFAGDGSAVTLEPLKGRCAPIFGCEDIDGLAEVDPVEIAFHRIQDPGREIIWRADARSTLWDPDTPPETLVPDDTDTIRHAVFRYRLSDRLSPAFVTVNQGHTIDYEREGHAAVLEGWLCRRGIIRCLPAAMAWFAVVLGRCIVDLDAVLPDGIRDLVSWRAL